ncbi:TPA: UDP-glucose 4-epimerase [Candidatus Acetothermia bacterium]|nr:UDP-glucose 4-epimerase [Candidatus Acetothermia bacterium]HAZ31009.1 UDP-glucose 4-epimerase [Candidatus Acetothermia bacterium]
MRILVTGATGQIGSELTLELRNRYGEDQVVAAGHRRPAADALAASGPFVSLDVSNRDALARVIAEHEIEAVYHLAAVLSATGEQNPQRAWEVNVNGLYHLLELARQGGVRQIFNPSSIAVFGPRTPRDRTPQDTILSPTTMYGVTKVTGELLCDYYAHRYGLDIRGLRYPGIISSETPPGGGTTDYAVEMFYLAVEGKPYTCFVRDDTVLPMMYMPDCLRAGIELMEAPCARLRARTYNITAMSFTAKELAAEIRKHVPGFRVEYVPDFRQAIADSWPRSIDDSAAQSDWGWKPRYGLPEMVTEMLAALSRRHAAGRLYPAG